MKIRQIINTLIVKFLLRYYNFNIQKKKSILEVGGPTTLFQNLKFYRHKVDNVNFSNSNTWTKSDFSKTVFRSEFICEASELMPFAVNYDYLISSNCLEHCANVLKTLKNWHFALNVGGKILVIVPNPSRTFDKGRPITTMDHLVEDFNRDVTENDDTHFNEIILHNCSTTDIERKIIEEHVRANYIHRNVHHHVFSLELLQASLKYVGFKRIHGFVYKSNIFCLGEK